MIFNTCLAKFDPRSLDERVEEVEGDENNGGECEGKAEHESVGREHVRVVGHRAVQDH